MERIRKYIAFSVFAAIIIVALSTIFVISNLTKEMFSRMEKRDSVIFELNEKLIKVEHEKDSLINIINNK